MKEDTDCRYQLVELQAAKDNSNPDATCTQSNSTTSSSILINGLTNEVGKDDIQLIESSISLRQNLSPDEFHSQLKSVSNDN